MFYITGFIGILTIIVLLFYLFKSNLKDSTLWRITVTPLAAIIGSGFLISAPLLYSRFASLSLPFVIMLNLVAIMFGGAVRFAIKEFDPKQSEIVKDHPILGWIEHAGNWILMACYFIATAFYVSLLSAFFFNLFGVEAHTIVWGHIPGSYIINTFSTVILVLLGVYGYYKGLHNLENLEKIAVNIKLAVIGGLIVSVVAYFIFSLLGKTSTTYQFVTTDITFAKIQMLAGLFLITQGFETVKFLGDDYSVEMRNKAMLLAQVLAAIIYVIFVPLVGPITSNLTGEITETAIIEVLSLVGFGMGLIITVSALFSQFGAATADIIAGGGLIEEETKRRLNERQAYIPFVGIAVVLIWLFPVMQIIEFASRFFALYYGMQIFIAMYMSFKDRKFKNGMYYLLLMVLAFFIFLFGVS